MRGRSSGIGKTVDSEHSARWRRKQGDTLARVTTKIPTLIAPPCRGRDLLESLPSPLGPKSTAANIIADISDIAVRRIQPYIRLEREPAYDHPCAAIRRALGSGAQGGRAFRQARQGRSCRGQGPPQVGPGPSCQAAPDGCSLARDCA